jgi:phosphate starvation-inducible PhoH-like protein
MVVTGDTTQVDLPGGTISGLRIVQDILEGVDDVAFQRLTSRDVVRHQLVSRIVEAYAAFDAVNAEGGRDGNRADRRAQSRRGGRR